MLQKLTKPPILESNRSGATMPTAVVLVYGLLVSLGLPIG
jgi:hypothetical protein